MWEISDEEKTEIRAAFDDIITNWGKPCTLVYPGKWTSCINCIYDGIGQKSSNRYRTGGPVPFSAGGCPVCNGVGKRHEEVTESLTLFCVFNPEKFFYPVPHLDLRTPMSYAQVKGYWSDFPKLQRAHLIYLQTNLDNYTRLAYKLIGEPLDINNIIPGRYFAATLERTHP